MLQFTRSLFLGRVDDDSHLTHDRTRSTHSSGSSSLLYSSEIQQNTCIKDPYTKYRVMLSMKSARGGLLCQDDPHRLIQSARVWVFNPWARALTGTPYNTQMDHGEEQIASYLTVLKIQQHTQHCITHIPAQRPGYLHLVISCIFTDQTLTEVWMEDEWKETKLLILQEVTKTFNRTFCCSVLASLYRERLYLQKECDCIYIHYAETFFVENLNGMSPIRQKSVQSSKYANKCK